MRVHTDLLGTRIAGTLLGLGFLLMGLYALFGGGDAVVPALRERASGFGVAALIAGLVAIPVSWLVRRLDNIWCAPPRRGWFRTASHESDEGVARNHGARREPGRERADGVITSPAVRGGPGRDTEEGR